MKIIAKTWSTGRAWTVGILVTENEFGERRLRCGVVAGINENHDLKFLMDWGSTLSLEDLQTMIDLVKEGKQKT